MKQRAEIFKRFGLPENTSFDLIGLSTLTNVPYDDLKRIYYAASATSVTPEVPKLNLQTGKLKAVKTRGNSETNAMKAVYIYIYDSLNAQNAVM